METVDVSGSAEQSPPNSLRAGVVHWEEHQKANAHIFPSQESWRWFARQHRADLISRGALCTLQGRIFVVADRFNAAMVEIGSRMAANKPT